MKRSSATWLIFIGLMAPAAIFFTGCKPNDTASPTDNNTVFEPSNETIEYSVDKDTVSYRPSGFHQQIGRETTSAEDEYNDRLDDYLDDPEDELRFDPEIFDFQDD